MAYISAKMKDKRRWQICADGETTDMVAAAAATKDLTFSEYVRQNMRVVARKDLESKDKEG